ncbi:MAG: hypothetical protein Q9M27_04345 [Mariprofundaceae bacterium]|nr:hypothetical protein [Mariprofundaceae bacterium]
MRSGKQVVVTTGLLCLGIAIVTVGIRPAASQTPSADADNPHYQYMDNETCGSCHQEKLQDYQSSLMGQTPHDKVFRQFYAAVNTRGKADGIGFRAFKPKGASDCASCHTPDVVLNAVFHGGHDAVMVRKAATLKASVKQTGDELLVNVDVTNSGAGHTFPGAATLRNVILVVDVMDDTGKRLAHTGSKKELLPPLADMGKSPRDFGGHAGAMFARPFATKSGKAPTGGFNADHALFDTRIRPGETAKRTFHFKKPSSGYAKVRVRLIYRWAFKPLVDKKGWKMDGIVIADRRLKT